MAELLLDPAIRMWVILPIVLISLLFGLLRHYVMVLLRSDNGSVTLEQIKDKYEGHLCLVDFFFIRCSNKYYVKIL